MQSLIILFDLLRHGLFDFSISIPIPSIDSYIRYFLVIPINSMSIALPALAFSFTLVLDGYWRKDLDCKLRR